MFHNAISSLLLNIQHLPSSSRRTWRKSTGLQLSVSLTSEVVFTGPSSLFSVAWGDILCHPQKNVIISTRKLQTLNFKSCSQEGFQGSSIGVQVAVPKFRCHYWIQMHVPEFRCQSRTSQIKLPKIRYQSRNSDVSSEFQVPVPEFRCQSRTPDAISRIQVSFPWILK